MSNLATYLCIAVKKGAIPAARVYYALYREFPRGSNKYPQSMLSATIRKILLKNLHLPQTKCKSHFAYTQNLRICKSGHVNRKQNLHT